MFPSKNKEAKNESKNEAKHDSNDEANSQISVRDIKISQEAMISDRKLNPLDSKVA